MNDSNKFILIFILVFLPNSYAFSDSIPPHIYKETVMFARKDTVILNMDIYRLSETENEKQPVMIFVFGGSFKRGKRDADPYLPYFIALTEKGITTISIDYRLGLVGRKLTLFNTSAANDAINMAVEDLYSATQYLLDNKDQLNIDVDCIMISGSSAGAITVLQADYYRKNYIDLSKRLPENFEYKGVIAFAGAIFSHKGTPDYKSAPAPTLFIHGDNDRVVFYNRLRFFRRGLFGSKSLAKRFKKRGYNYCFLTMEKKGHSVAVTPMKDNLDIIEWFIENYIYQERDLQLDASLYDINKPIEKAGTFWKLYKNPKTLPPPKPNE